MSIDNCEWGNGGNTRIYHTHDFYSYNGSDAVQEDQSSGSDGTGAG